MGSGTEKERVKALAGCDLDSGLSSLSLFSSHMDLLTPVEVISE